MIPFWCALIHSVLLIGGLYFLLVLCRLWVLYHALNEIVEKNKNEIFTLIGACENVDDVLRKSLRFLRDTEVIGRGHTTHTTKRAINLQVSTLKTVA